MPKKKIVLHFPYNLVNQPIVVTLVKEYDLSFNILKAKILPEQEGVMVLELHGDEKQYNAGIKYLEGIGITIEPLSKDIKRDDEKCTHCGACVTFCPTEALKVDVETREIIFDSEKCIACELCIAPCPVNAMELHF
ncbi:MAG: NIL domain-containing protein [Elusimicrobiota bacterium]